MKEALNNLLKVKSLMTLCVMIVFVYLAVTHNMTSELIASVITSVITYYFTKKDTEVKDDTIKNDAMENSDKESEE